MSGLELGRPWVASLLLLLPLLWLLLHWLLKRSRQNLARYGALPTAPLPVPLWRSLRTTGLIGLGVLCWCDPRFGDEQVTVERRGLDLVLCLDTSRSMLADDCEPTRLARALRDIKAVLPRLAGGDRVALVVFAGQARLWVPLTHDLDSFAGLLDEVDTDVVKMGGTDLAAALRKCGQVADVDHAATTAVVLLTDGEDLAGAGLQAARELAERKIVVHAIGYGGTLGRKIPLSVEGHEEFLRDQQQQEVVTRMDSDSLRRLAQAAQGEFVRADAMALPVVELHEKRLLPMEKRVYDAGQEQAKQARYQWVLLPLLLLLLWDIITAQGRHAWTSAR